MTQSPYVNRFERLLEPLQLRLAELQKNLDSIKDDHPDKQKTKLDVLTQINKTKQDIENTKKNLECSKEITIVRSDKVPNKIADHNVWNDCWYDEKRKLFVTHNKYFMKFEDVWKRPHQIQYQKETNDDGIIIKPEQIEFRFGYPSVIQKNSENEDVWFLLPTMTDNMLIDEIVMSRIKPKSQKDAILYRTKAERWITVGTDGFSMCEKENEISDKFGIFPPVPLEELKTLYGRN